MLKLMKLDTSFLEFIQHELLKRVCLFYKCLLIDNISLRAYLLASDDDITRGMTKPETDFETILLS